MTAPPVVIPPVLHGFGQKVTGCGPDPVVTAPVSSAAELAAAISDAVPYTLVYVENAITAVGGPLYVSIETSHLTLRGAPGSTIAGVCFEIDCGKADDVLLQNLRLSSGGDDDPDKAYPPDGIRFHTVGGTCETGYAIDHCTFGPFPDQCVQTYAKKDGTEKLRLSIADCRFDGDPGWPEQGSIEISAYAQDGGPPNGLDVLVTVYRNYFRYSRRRSPRASQYTFVHAYHNVLEDWGAADDVQSNGMTAGNFGQLAAIANYFDAGEFVKLAIDVSGSPEPGWAQLNGTDTNMYVNGALGPPAFDIDGRYEAVGLIAPTPQPMTETLAKEIKDGARALLSGDGAAPASR